MRHKITPLILTAAAAGCLMGCGDEESTYDKPLDSAVAEEIGTIAASDERLTGELENKTIKWMATWDINPDSTGKSTPVELEIFQKRYGGKIEFHSITFETRFEELANAINAGEGIDFYSASDLDVIPRGAIKDMFVPIDDYVDLDGPLYSDVKAAMDSFVWKGSHYVFVNDVVGDNCAFIYNRDTMAQNNLPDPLELYEKGEWNWDTFTDMLKQFVDVTNERYGIDGFWFEAGLSATCGVPYIGLEDGLLKNNLKDPAIERLQNWFYELGTSDYVLMGRDNIYETREALIGQGKLLCFPCGLWKLYMSKDQWEPVFGENVMFVPMPKDPDADAYYIPVGLDGYTLVKGGQNPEGVAKFAACKRVLVTNERTYEIRAEQMMSDYGWTQEMIDMKEELDNLARENPRFEFMNAVSQDVSDILDSNEYGIRAAAKGVSPWNESVTAIYAAVDAYLDEANNS